MADITVIGSMNMDMVIHTPRLPALGETILGSGFMTAPGGKGANQAIAAARLGGDVAMVGCVGNDLFGQALIKNLRANGVDTSCVGVLDSVPTGVAAITVKDGDNCIIVDMGANAALCPDMLDRHAAIFKGGRIALIQLEIPLDAVRHAASLLRREGVRVLLNPAPARTVDDALLLGIDILTPNEYECAALTGIPIHTAEDAKRAVRVLMDKGVKQVVVTLGKNGAVYNDGSALAHQPAIPVQAVDTTGAGDSFSSALAVALTAGKPIGEAVRFACAVGALTVQRRGAQSALPRLDEALRFLEQADFPAHTNEKL